jgi:predicted phosphodiesterase
MKLSVISDIHSDLISLQEVMREIDKLKCDKILCLGDIVGYNHNFEGSLDGRDADACVRMVKNHCDYVICGNHDLHAIRKIPSYHDDMGMPDNWYELDLEEKERVSKSHLWLYEDEINDPVSEPSFEFLNKLPEYMVIEAGEFKILATHFIEPDITGTSKLSPSGRKDFSAHLKLLKNNKCLVGLAGHAHLEGFARISRRDYLMNYYRKSHLLKKRQIIVGPPITRNKGSRGFIIMDTLSREFEAISLK